MGTHNNPNRSRSKARSKARKRALVLVHGPLTTMAPGTVVDVAALVRQHCRPAPPAPVADLLVSWEVLSTESVLLAPDAACVGCAAPMWSTASSACLRVTPALLVCPACAPPAVRRGRTQGLTPVAVMTAMLAASPDSAEAHARRMWDVGVPAEVIQPALRAATAARRARAVDERRDEERRADVWRRDAATLTDVLDRVFADTGHTYECTDFDRNGHDWEIEIYVDDGSTYAGFVCGTLSDIKALLTDVIVDADRLRAEGAPCPTCGADQWDATASSTPSWVCRCGTEFLAVTSWTAQEGILGEAPWPVVCDRLALTPPDVAVVQLADMLAQTHRSPEGPPAVWASVSSALSGVVRAEFGTRAAWALTPAAGVVPEDDLPAAVRVGAVLGERGYQWQEVLDHFYDPDDDRHVSTVVALRWDHPDRDELVVYMEDQWWVARTDDWWLADADTADPRVQDAVAVLYDKWACESSLLGDWQVGDDFPLGGDSVAAAGLIRDVPRLSGPELHRWVTDMVTAGSAALSELGRARHADLVSELGRPPEVG